MEERIIFDKANGWRFFNALFEASGQDSVYFAKEANVSSRTVRSWRSGETSMPKVFAQKWSVKFTIAFPEHKTFSLGEKRRTAGLIGGKARIKIWGPLGTAEGRSKGGRRSQETHKKKKVSPFIAKKIQYPKKSSLLAEFIGAALGDGCMTKFQVILYASFKDELEYAEFIKNLIFTLFGISARAIPDRKHGVIRILSSRRELVRFMEYSGCQIGNKKKLQVTVPAWIEQNPEYAQACLRGLIDTDGCVYIDRHCIKGKRYQSTCIAFTNTSVPLLNFVENQWQILGYVPTRTGRDVRLRRRTDVLSYSKTIGFSNPKHSRKITV